MLGVSSVDGTTPVMVKVNPVTGRMLADADIVWPSRAVAAGEATDAPTSADGIVQYSTDGAQALTVTLPEAASNIGTELTLTFETDGGQDITVNRTGADTLDENADTGNTSFVMANAGETIVLRAIQDNIWLVVARVGGTLS